MTTGDKMQKGVFFVIHYRFSNTLHHPVDHVPPHRVMAASVVVCCVLFSRDELLRVEKIFVFSNPDLVCDEQMITLLLGENQEDTFRPITNDGLE